MCPHVAEFGITRRGEGKDRTCATCNGILGFKGRGSRRQKKGDRKRVTKKGGREKDDQISEQEKWDKKRGTKKGEKGSPTTVQSMAQAHSPPHQPWTRPLPLPYRRGFASTTRP